MTTLDLDRDHILAVCGVVVTRPSIPATSSENITLAFPHETQRDRAEDALRRSGYDTEATLLDDAHRYGIQITGWSPDELERRAARLHSAQARYSTHTWLHDTAGQAIDAAADTPADAHPISASYEIATEITDRVIGRVLHHVGPLVPLTLPTDPQLGEQLREQLRDIQRLTDRVSSMIGDHFNVACIAAATYIHTRHEQPGNKPGNNHADPAAGPADEAARDQAWAEARAFIADPVDPDAFLDAAQWAHHQQLDPDQAGAFALDYGRAHRGTDRDQRPRPEQAYPAWRDAQAAADPPATEPAPPTPSATPSPTQTATQVAAADFPNQPGDAATAEPAQPQAQDTSRPARTRATRRPQ